MEWSRQQDEALRQAGNWLKNPGGKQVFRLFGYAGTGKTTIAQTISENVNKTLYAAYTGKAASVMRASGCSGAGTIHQLIYLPAEKSRSRYNKLNQELAELRSTKAPDDPACLKEIELVKQLAYEGMRVKQPGFILNEESELNGSDLLIIDEASMVGSNVAEDLLSFDVPILVLGDPAQLPPVGDSGYFTDKTPDVMLTDIHRQAKDSPIIEMATIVREGGVLKTGKYGSSEVTTSKPPGEVVTSFDQVIVGKNTTRKYCNAKMRELLGRTNQPIPEAGDRLVCLKNNHKEGLLNGTLWQVHGTTPSEDHEDRIQLDIEGDSGRITVESHLQYFRGEEPDYWSIRDAESFDFGYALTAHKAQGSQWGSVFIFDESYVFRKDARKWLYTAITRAADKVVIKR